MMKKEYELCKSRRSMLIAALAALAPFAAAQAADTGAGSSQYQTVSPLGFEIPSPGSRTTAPMRADTEMIAASNSVSPLGFEIPAPTPRGIAGPMRSDSVSGVSPTGDLFKRLGGIGGTDTN
jgi:hypothetical protein